MNDELQEKIDDKIDDAIDIVEGFERHIKKENEGVMSTEKVLELLDDMKTDIDYLR